MPEGRQRITSKADKKLKNLRTNDNSEYGEQGDEDEPDDESEIKDFIEASCYNLRHLILTSLMTHSISDMEGSNGETTNLPTKKRKHLRAGDSDLVVLSVVLNRKQKENDEVSLAIERLRKNGVTCAFFTMDDIRNGNTKSDTKLSNGFVSHASNTSKTSGIINTHLLNVSGSCADKEKDLGNKNSSIEQNLTPCTVQLNPIVDAPLKLPFAASVPCVNTTHLLGMEVEVLNTDFDKSSEEENFKVPVIPSKGKRKRRRKNSFIARKFRPRKRNVPTTDTVCTRKVGRGRPRKETSANITSEGTSLLMNADTLTSNVLLTEIKPLSEQSANLADDNPATVVSLIEPEIPLEAINCTNINNGPLNVKIPLVKVIVVENKSDMAPKNKRNYAAKENLKSKQSNVIKLLAGSKINKTQSAERDSSEQNLAKFCLGDRATKSIAAERIKRCFTEETKKQSRFTPTGSQKSFMSATTGARKSTRKQNKTSKVQINESTNKLSDIVVEKVEKADETKNSFETKLVEENKPSDSDVFKFDETDESSVCSTPIRKRPMRRVCLSPDIAVFSTSATIRNKKCSKSTMKRVHDQALSSDTAKCSKSQLVFPLLEPVTLPQASQTTPLNEIRVHISSTLPQANAEPESEANVVKQTLFDLINQVLSQIQKDQASNGNVPSSTINGSAAAVDSLGLLTVDTESQHDASTVSAGSKVLMVPVGESNLSPVKEGLTYTDDSLPDNDVMQLRRSSFYSLISGNVRTNMENYLDGKKPESPYISQARRRRRIVKNGFLLHHGDNCPEDPESPYKFHLATQVLLKLNRRRSKCSPKEERTKNLLSYLKLTPKRSIRIGKSHSKGPEVPKLEPDHEASTFSGDWTIPRKFICGVCGQVELTFWDMVTHKGENHPGVVVTHVELPSSQEPPSSLVRNGPLVENQTSFIPKACTKCCATFNTLSDLHRHIFECAGNSAWLVAKVPTKRKSRRRRGFKRRLSNTPRKTKKLEVVKRQSDPFKCIFCGREFKTEGWLRNHTSTHSLPVSIPLEKLPLPLPVRACIRKCKL